MDLDIGGGGGLVLFLGGRGGREGWGLLGGLNVVISIVFISLFLCIIYRNLKHSMIIKKPSMDPGSVYRRFLPLMTCV